jgi:hypothetical protein
MKGGTDARAVASEGVKSSASTAKTWWLSSLNPKNAFTIGTSENWASSRSRSCRRETKDDGLTLVQGFSICSIEPPESGQRPYRPLLHSTTGNPFHSPIGDEQLRRRGFNAKRSCGIEIELGQLHHRQAGWLRPVSVWIASA